MDFTEKLNEYPILADAYSKNFGREAPTRLSGRALIGIATGAHAACDKLIVLQKNHSLTIDLSIATFANIQRPHVCPCAM